MKWKRSVFVEITPKKGDPIEVKGLRVKFNIKKSLETALNSGTVEIYNMNKRNRDSVVFKYNLHSNLYENANTDIYGGKIKVIAGYEGNEKTLFEGDIISAASVRIGGDYITTISAQTKAEALESKNISKTFPKGTDYKSILDHVIGSLDLPAIKTEANGYLEKIMGGVKLGSGETVEGSSISVLDAIVKRFGGKVAINFDEQGINVHGAGISPDLDPKFFFSKESGLVGAPSITNKGADLKVLLEPTIRMSDLITVTSPTTMAGDLDPFFVVKGITHVGDSREGEFMTNITSWYLSAASTIPAST
jgi:hypothetical protein